MIRISRTIRASYKVFSEAVCFADYGSKEIKNSRFASSPLRRFASGGFFRFIVIASQTISEAVNSFKSSLGELLNLAGSVSSLYR